MSTFNGLVAEFPDIRVDFFRSHPDRRHPLACFLSHIHSDHLAGLESLRSPLYRYPCRINYANGILEARVQRYRHLKTLLKLIPLDTPTVLELEPGNHLQVTLFDANHCPGAVMFLFEGQGKAVLYTGDIRSEPWFVITIARSPSLIEYSTGLKTLDTIYLDTSFIDDIDFPTKSEGISELLREVSRYPPDTIFHFQAWTYGYEEVWLALSKALGSRIHVDKYKLDMFRSLVAMDPENKFAPSYHLAPEAPGLAGFMCGNTYHAGCLTLDESVRLHSCEKGNYCATVKNSRVVWIQPIITRLPDGHDVAEIGDELDYLSQEDVVSLLAVLGNIDGISEHMRKHLGQTREADLISGLKAMTRKLQNRRRQQSTNDFDNHALPNIVTFPYSRHSSYPELCHLVRAFKPRDVWPCTVDSPRWLGEGITVRCLFAEYCSGEDFRHDDFMRERFRDSVNNAVNNIDSQVTVSSANNAAHLSQASATEPEFVRHVQEQPLTAGGRQPRVVDETEIDLHVVEIHPDNRQTQAFGGFDPIEGVGGLEGLDPTSLLDSQYSSLSETGFEARFQVFQASLENAQGRAGGQIGLLSTTDNHSTLEAELTYLRH
ncbi:hypothetical protein N658DRAFT_514742 [Parathielavia hyrcaniae]|uniref:Protein artemis n=1 Tax=Parathielavia hyrcaniae TaxID=113614 RepID=A0AAN6T305_9PEZI|nr:hypothetical protein N658DRAFT_514742 [Parathielavia hyrcaniae]